MNLEGNIQSCRGDSWQLSTTKNVRCHLYIVLVQTASFTLSEMG